MTDTERAYAFLIEVRDSLAAARRACETPWFAFWRRRRDRQLAASLDAAIAAWDGVIRTAQGHAIEQALREQVAAQVRPRIATAGLLEPVPTQEDTVH